jgi:hypothetical protein
MHDSWWDDYKWCPNSDHNQYFAAICLLQTLDRFGLVEVRPCYRSNPHSCMDIWVDDVYYMESVESFVSRFKNR